MSLQEEIAKYRQEIKSERMDMSFGEIINMYKDREIIISPAYQRAFRWDEKRQSDFIESILLGIPFPSIFVAANPDGKWELIDGLQRISTVLSFFGELKDENGKPYEKNGLVLQEGSMIKKMKGLTIDTLPLEYKLQIKRTPCRVEVVLKESNFEMRYELFKRLNTGGEGLSRQEMRNCIFRGIDNKYNEFVCELAKNEEFRELVPVRISEANKMYYEELVLRYLTLKNSGTRYKQANIQDYMDDYLKKQCYNFDPSSVEQDREIFYKIIHLLSELAEYDIFKLGKRYFTTSMYDSIMLSLATVKDIYDIDVETLALRIEELKKNERFNQYIGSASSNPTSITNKVKIAKAILIDYGKND